MISSTESTDEVHPIITADNLAVGFRDNVVWKDATFTIGRGEFVAIIGPNGAGKTTTIKMLTGLLAPTSGAMRILGSDLAKADDARAVKRRVGVVPEDLALFDNLTAREYLTFIGLMYLVPPATIRQRCEELLAMMDLGHEEKKITLEYSHGMKKKLALAAALLPAR